MLGRLGGEHMARYVQEVGHVPVEPDAHRPTEEWMRSILSRESSTKIAHVRDELQERMDENASVYRTEQTLTRMQGLLGDLRAKYDRAAIDDKGSTFNTDLVEAMELGFLLDLADALVASALARRESRGGHAREDYPNRDDVNFLSHTLAYRQPDGGIELRYKPVKLGRYEPQERKY